MRVATLGRVAPSSRFSAVSDTGWVKLGKVRQYLSWDPIRTFEGEAVTQANGSQLYALSDDYEVRAVFDESAARSGYELFWRGPAGGGGSAFIPTSQPSALAAVKNAFEAAAKPWFMWPWVWAAAAGLALVSGGVYYWWRAR